MGACRCFICGKSAGYVMKNGTWICRDHINLLGGMRRWKEIRMMTPQQVYYRLGVDADNVLLKGFEPSESDTVWRDSMKAARQMSENTGRPVVVRQNNSGCGAAIGFIVLLGIVIPLFMRIFASK